ncbi:hypothetical protein HYH03_005843 [Edaphochlamys debaryana]|uniref:Protein kinase domain-containing protein n=1 Tax=Edaphochlamys debaryana TaxID=47281 RepID=A0A835Y509_9CHLO|nr:hypothetical protein HYH03_005843 [Edaphochlamys debaryana]|eukprot:KAG2496245.1 hypothetical protein HYH03_005843 [Edaphochlamys debaryana]
MCFGICFPDEYSALPTSEPAVKSKPAAKPGLKDVNEEPKLQPPATKWRDIPLTHKYTFIKQIGKGGFSEIWLAEDRETRVRKAVKVVQLANAELEPEEVTTLIAEAKFLRNLDCPYLVKCEDFTYTDEWLVLVLEYLGGGEMLDHIHKVVKYTEADAARLFAQIVSAIAYLHNLNMMHRDLKPENVIFTIPVEESVAQGLPLRVKIIDLGMAGLYDPAKEVRGCVGTPGFVAPELWNDKPHTPACDIYSLGAMLFIMLTGRKPHGGLDIRMMTYCNKSIKDAPGLKDERFLSLSPTARDLLLRMLADDPGARPSCMDVLHHPFIAAVDSNMDAHREIGDVVRKRMRELAQLRRVHGLRYALRASQPAGGDQVALLDILDQRRLRIKREAAASLYRDSARLLTSGQHTPALGTEPLHSQLVSQPHSSSADRTELVRPSQTMDETAAANTAAAAADGAADGPDRFRRCSLGQSFATPPHLLAPMVRSGSSSGSRDGNGHVNRNANGGADRCGSGPSGGGTGVGAAASVSSSPFAAASGAAAGPGSRSAPHVPPLNLAMPVPVPGAISGRGGISLPPIAHSPRYAAALAAATTAGLAAAPPHASRFADASGSRPGSGSIDVGQALHAHHHHHQAGHNDLHARPPLPPHHGGSSHHAHTPHAGTGSGPGLGSGPGEAQGQGQGHAEGLASAPQSELTGDHVQPARARTQPAGAAGGPNGSAQATPRAFHRHSQSAGNNDPHGHANGHVHGHGPDSHAATGTGAGMNVHVDTMALVNALQPALHHCPSMPVMDAALGAGMGLGLGEHGERLDGGSPVATLEMVENALLTRCLSANPYTLELMAHQETLERVRAVAVTDDHAADGGGGGGSHPASARGPSSHAHDSKPGSNSHR